MDQIEPHKSVVLLDYTNQTNKILRYCKPRLLQVSGIGGILIGIVSLLIYSANAYIALIIFNNIGPKYIPPPTPVSHKTPLIDTRNLKPFNYECIGKQGSYYSIRELHGRTIRFITTRSAYSDEEVMYERLLADVGQIAFPPKDRSNSNIVKDETGQWSCIETTRHAIINIGTTSAELVERSSGKIWTLKDWILIDPDGQTHIASNVINEIVLDGISTHQLQLKPELSHSPPTTPEALGSAVELLRRVHPNLERDRRDDFHLDWSRFPNQLNIYDQLHEINPDGTLVGDSPPPSPKPPKTYRFTGSRMATAAVAIVSFISCLMSGILIMCAIELIADKPRAIRNMNAFCVARFIVIPLEILAMAWFTSFLESPVRTLPSMSIPFTYTIVTFVFMSAVGLFLSLGMVIGMLVYLTSRAMRNHAHFHGEKSALFSTSSAHMFQLLIGSKLRTKPAISCLVTIIGILTASAIAMSVCQYRAYYHLEASHTANIILLIIVAHLVIGISIILSWCQLRSKQNLMISAFLLISLTITRGNRADEADIQQLQKTLKESPSSKPQAIDTNQVKLDEVSHKALELHDKPWTEPSGKTMMRMLGIQNNLDFVQSSHPTYRVDPPEPIVLISPVYPLCILCAIAELFYPFWILMISIMTDPDPPDLQDSEVISPRDQHN